ncbi:eukaryotic translation initiation factor 4 gamma [Holotrichia oblita]|uniref:Eukaryotic translation initiation factor 4 gamma n=1 Tax=Holotrichia oblita TaxID=644536 RepID=A0ACB9T8A4_HOLOL|nr:eukaryotic translation initiation factor 4 gamma [Holotrichia oblita]
MYIRVEKVGDSFFHEKYNYLHLNFRCIQELLITRKGDDPSEDLECLCQILRTCGRILDTDKGKKLMDQYFERMSLLADNTDLAPRIRFMLKDIIDLRHEGWMPRKATIVEGPMPIHQIRPTEDDRPGYRRDRNPDRDTERSSSSELFRHPMKTRGGIEDMLLNINLAPTGPNLISAFNGFGGGGGQREGGFRGHNNQRSGFPNYNNQRGQYKHNQNNANTQYNNQSNKELAPRFKKNLIVSHNIGDVELRPAPNSLFNKAVKTNNIMNSKPMDALPATPKQTPTPLLKESLPIKPVSAEKPKQTKKDKGPNKEEVMKKYFALIDDYLKGDVTLQESVDIYKENKVPDKFLKDTVTNSLKQSLDKTDEDREKYITFFSALRKENLISNSVIHEVFKLVCNVLEERENEITKVMEASSVLFSSAVSAELVSLFDIANLTDSGVHYPLFLLVLQRLRRTMGKNELTQLFNNSRINLLSQLPENDRTKERLTEILEEKDLTFLYPLLRIQAELSKQLQVDPNPQVFYKWIKENLDSVNYTDPGFINALMTVLLKYITQEAVLVSEGDDKGIAEKERSMLERYLPILKAFLHEQPTLQLVAVYSLQVHLYAQGFPRGQLLRWFMALYDLEIVEEEAFLNWKEDVTDAYPGKGQALFQVRTFIAFNVNQWLTWLQEAESEEEEEGDE